MSRYRSIPISSLSSTLQGYIKEEASLKPICVKAVVLLPDQNTEEPTEASQEYYRRDDSDLEDFAFIGALMTCFVGF